MGKMVVTAGSAEGAPVASISLRGATLKGLHNHLKGMELCNPHWG